LTIRAGVLLGVLVSFAVEIDHDRRAVLRRVAQTALRPVFALAAAAIELLDAVQRALLHGERDERVFLAGGMEQRLGFGIGEIQAGCRRHRREGREGVACGFAHRR